MYGQLVALIFYLSQLNINAVFNPAKFSRIEIRFFLNEDKRENVFETRDTLQRILEVYNWLLQEMAKMINYHRGNWHLMASQQMMASFH